MFTEKNFKNTLITYSFFTLFCIVFAIIYTKLGHGVVSWPLRLSFIFPLLGAIFFYFFFKLGGKKCYRMAFNSFNAGIATLTIGGIYQGVIDIAGADTNYGVFYLIFGALLLITSFILQILKK